MISIENVTKKFGLSNVLDNVSIDIPKGQIYGLIGENGAGKTTLIRCLAGIYTPESGRIRVDGQNVCDNPAIKKHIGYVADTNQFFPYETVKGMIRFFQSMYGDFSKERFDELNEQFQLDKNKRILHLSKGMQMRLAFMLALSIRPKALILDEPTSGLDAVAKHILLNMLIEEVEQNGTTVFISSHHLNELEKLCDRMSILQNGKIIYETDMEQLKSNIRKFQAVFQDGSQDGSQDGFSSPLILHREKIGSIHYFIADNTGGLFEQALKERGAFVIEEINLSLEEIFIHTVSQTNRGA